jgi:hypothetical protein
MYISIVLHDMGYDKRRSDLNPLSRPVADFGIHRNTALLFSPCGRIDPKGESVRKRKASLTGKEEPI